MSVYRGRNRRPNRRSGRVRKLFFAFLGVAAVAAVIGGITTPAQAGGGGADEPTKAAVCKYVGKPGVSERLQTGGNPIVVDRKDSMVIGTFFQDAHGRSYVLEFLNPGDPEPDVSRCPLPDTGTTIDLPTPQVNDPCGSHNATWVKPSDTDVLHWTLANGDLTVAIVADNTHFADDSTSHDYGTAPDSNVACPEEPKTVTPAAPAFTEKCGTANDKLVIPSSEGVSYQVNGVPTAAGTYPATGTVHVVAFPLDDTYVLAGTASWSHAYTDESCGSNPPPQCTNGDSPGDLNGDGVANQQDCEPIVVCENCPKPPHGHKGHKPPKVHHHKAPRHHRSHAGQVNGHTSVLPNTGSDMKRWRLTGLGTVGTGLLMIGFSLMLGSSRRREVS